MGLFSGRVEMGDPRCREGVCPHNISDAVAAEIYRWGDDRLGVQYYFSTGKWKAHEVTADDWPVIERLEREGRAVYQNDDVRALVQRARKQSR
jgi:hypothetical protein